MTYRERKKAVKELKERDYFITTEHNIYQVSWLTNSRMSTISSSNTNSIIFNMNSGKVLYGTETFIKRISKETNPEYFL